MVCLYDKVLPLVCFIVLIILTQLELVSDIIEAHKPIDARLVNLLIMSLLN